MFFTRFLTVKCRILPVKFLRDISLYNLIIHTRRHKKNNEEIWLHCKQDHQTECLKYQFICDAEGKKTTTKLSHLENITV